jgi:hypothetical protein
MSMSMLHVHVNVQGHVYKCQNSGLSSIRSVRYRNDKKLMIPKELQYRTKLTQSGVFFIVQYRSKNSGCHNAGAGVSFVDAMPSYD